MNQKNILRQHYLKLRRQLTPKQQREKSEQIRKLIIKSQQWQAAKHIMFFTAFKGEPNLLLSKNRLPRRVPSRNDEGKQLYLPKTHADYTMTTEPKLNLKELDLVLVPAVAVDRQGYRLGWGIGYYDRFLVNIRAITMTVVFADCLSLTPLPHEAHDISTDFICTENGILST